MAILSKPSLRLAVWRGLRGLCPHCGRGRLFYRYLKVFPLCESCGHDLDRYPSDDGPAYFTNDEVGIVADPSGDEIGTNNLGSNYLALTSGQAGDD